MIQYLLPLSANETRDAQQLLCLYVFFFCMKFTCLFQSNPDVFIHFIVLHAIEENAIGTHQANWRQMR